MKISLFRCHGQMFVLGCVKTGRKGFSRSLFDHSGEPSSLWSQSTYDTECTECLGGMCAHTAVHCGSGEYLFSCVTGFFLSIGSSPL